MTLKTQLKLDVLKTFLNGNDFAEDVSYTPYGGVAKTILAIVDRNRVEPLIEDSTRVLADRAEVFIANDATYGVAYVNKQGDMIAVPAEVGQANVTMRVVDILGCDNGMWHLLCQK